MKTAKRLIICGALSMAAAVVLYYGSLFYLYSLVGSGMSQDQASSGVQLVQAVQYLCYGLGLLGLTIVIAGLVKQSQQTRVQSK